MGTSGAKFSYFHRTRINLNRKIIRPIVIIIKSFLCAFLMQSVLFSCSSMFLVLSVSCWCGWWEIRKKGVWQEGVQV